MPRWFTARLMAACFTWVTAASSGIRGQDGPRPIDFNRDVRPILAENCFHCHGADARQRKGKLRLDVAEGAIQSGAIVPGKPDQSTVVSRIFSAKEDEQMPPPESNRRLTPAQKQVLRAWIQGGAKYDAHWAFKTAARPTVPSVRQKEWMRNPIDAFVLARLEQEGLAPSPPAPVDILLRRVSLDLTGLPPNPAQIKRWRSASDPMAAAVTELLAHPGFGERMASDWMDIARYADTHGFNNDSARTMWRWRDWVISAFNRNLPYDRFVTEQLAGDLLERPTLDQLIATGFNRNHVINSEGGIIDEEYRVEYVADRVRTMALAWLGLTVECARCHDHKFDPVTQRDYYRLFAFFNSIDEHGEDGRIANASPIVPSPTDSQQSRIAHALSTMKSASAEMQRLQGAMGAGRLAVSTKTAPLGQPPGFQSTNLVVGLDLAAWKSGAGSISNLARLAQPFAVTGEVASAVGPLAEAAIHLKGGSLRTSSLPKSDSGKGWAFMAWVRRDGPGPGALFSTMKFNVPASSGGYGGGVEVRLTEAGAVEVRIARRWPAYSLNLVTREVLAPNQWHHVLVTCDGSGWARGARLFLDGDECHRDVLHDDLQGSLGIAGEALVGATMEPGGAAFHGALAGLTLVSNPFQTDALAAWSRMSMGRAFAAGAAVEPDRGRRALLEESDPEFARLAADWRAAWARALSEEREAPTTMIMRELRASRPTHVLFRGQYDQPRELVTPDVPAALLHFPDGLPRNRLGLAAWLTDRRNPLMARVVVNRFWQSLFGTGIVKTAEDFGLQSEAPSHPELLDWLAVEFIESGWNVKHLMRLMATSAAYGQDSRAPRDLYERDPENRLLARGPRQRLTAEMLRDQALSLAGVLSDEVGGPPAYPYQPANLYKGIVVAADYPGTSYTESQGSDRYRRSLYTFWKRTVPHPTLATFDAPDREVCVARRLRTNTPLQALALMNDPIQVDAAQHLARRMVREGGASPAERVRFGFQLATGRLPAADEVRVIEALFAKRLAGAAPGPDSAHAAYAHVASLILNLDETITRN